MEKNDRNLVKKLSWIKIISLLKYLDSTKNVKMKYQFFKLNHQVKFKQTKEYFEY